MVKKKIKQGATRYYIKRTHDLFGNRYAKPKREEVICKDCKKLWTSSCPIRVWGRNENQKEKLLDVNSETDYCSRFESR